MNPTATHEYAAATDTALSAAWEALDNARLAVRVVSDSIHYAVGDKKDYRVKSHPVWRLNETVAIEKLMTLEEKPWEQGRHAELLNEHGRACEVRGARELEVERLEQLYTGWARFFIVPGGHIHSSRRCSTCYPTTMFGWLPALSGLTEADAVAAHGPLLCSVCYPLAPVEWTVGPQSKKEYCSGTGKAPAVDPKVGQQRRYMACPDCGKYGAVTSTGLVRAHKP